MFKSLHDAPGISPEVFHVVVADRVHDFTVYRFVLVNSYIPESNGTF